MKKISKKLIGSLMVGMMIATIGVVFVSAQTDKTNGTMTQQPVFRGERRMFGQQPFFSDLTEEQQVEIDALREELKDQGATPEEIRAAIQEKLDEYGIFDQRLDNEIIQTQQHLTILNREKELRDQGYSWDEIQQTIQDEFGISVPVGNGHGMFGHDFGRGSCKGRFHTIRGI
ncbi:MAG: hypothetical protein V1726_03315 [Methanobacteriota archaeon]